MKKILSVVLATIMVVGLAAGCGQKAAAPAETQAATAAQTQAAASGEKVTLSVACNVDVQEAFDAFFEAFEKANPNITIDFVPMGAAEEAAFLSARMASNTMPDVFGITAGSFANGLADDGTLYDLKGSVAASRVLDGALAPMTSPGGHIYGITYGLASTCLFYNKEMFEKFGLTAPTNWEELMAVCEKLKAQGVIPLSIATDASIGNTFFSYGFGNNMGSKDWSASMADGSFDLTCPEVVDIFEKYKECGDKGYFQDGYVSADYNSSNELFIQGQAAMLFTGIWFAGSLEAADFTVASVVPPMNAKGADPYVVVSTESGWGVNAKSAHLEEALKLMDFFTGDGYAVLQNPRGSVPALKDASAAKVNYIVKDFLPYFDSSKTCPLYFNYLPAVFMTDLNKVFQDVGSGKLTPADAAAKCATLYKDSFK